MLLLRRFVVCVALVSGPLSASEYHISFEECARLLVEDVPNDLQSATEAEELYSWISLRHPIVRTMLARNRSLNLAFDLFFLSTGFHFPPKFSRFSSRSTVAQQWRRLMIKTPNVSLGADPGPSFVGRVSETFASTQYLSPKLKRRYQFLEVLSSDSLWTLWLMAVTIHREPGLVAGYPRVTFDVTPRQPGFARYASARFDWQRSFTTAELDALYAALEKVRKPAVRAHFMHMLDARLEALAAEQRAMCERLKTCDGVDDFNRVYLDLKSGLRPRPVGTAAEAYAALSPVNPPVEFKSDDIRSFLVDRKPLTAGDVADLPLIEILADLNRMTSLVGQALLQIESWRADAFRWQAWSDALVPTMAAVEQLRFDLDVRSREISAARATFEAAGRDVANLRAWLADVHAAISKVDKSDERVANLSFQNQLALSSIVTTLPLLRTLTEQATAAIDGRGVVMVRNLTTMSSLLVVIADLVTERVRDVAVDERLDGNAKFDQLRVLIDEADRP